MKTEIPEEFRAAVPQTPWGKLLVATPIIMTVIATMLAALSSSEMTRAQYTRSLAAQQQSKAGDQWSYFQAKRLRGAMQNSTLDLLTATTTLRPLDAAALKSFGDVDERAVAALVNGQLPATPVLPADPAIKTALGLVEGGRPEAEIAAALAKISEQELQHSLKAARERADAVDDAFQPVNQTIDRIEAVRAAAPSNEASRDFIAARLRYAAARYDAEAKANLAVATVLELQVRKSNLIADRYNRRSQRFFYGMIAAQGAVVISTFSLAAQKRSMLWSLAAAAGLAALGFAIYVYFYI